MLPALLPSPALPCCPSWAPSLLRTASVRPSPSGLSPPAWPRPANSRANAAKPPTEQALKERLNAWTIGLAAGRLEGAPLTFASELARVLDDGDNMRVMPIVTRGPSTTSTTCFICAASMPPSFTATCSTTSSRSPSSPTLARRINYLINLFPSEAHVFARPEIKSVQDLAGKVVNFNTPGTAAAYSGPIIFKLLGIEVKATFIPAHDRHGQDEGRRRVRRHLLDLLQAAGPVPEGQVPEGFKFLPIEYNDKLEYYAPAYLAHADYPALIPEGQAVSTISVPAVLAVYDWSREPDRQRRLVRLVDYLFDRFERLQKEPGYHQKWKDVNLAATVPGWERFKPLQDKLDQMSTSALRSVNTTQPRAQGNGMRRPTAPSSRSACSNSSWSGAREGNRQ